MNEACKCPGERAEDFLRSKGGIFMANSKIAGCGFHHVALQTSDFEKSLKFYTEGLGFCLRAKWNAESGRRLALIDIGDGSYFELFSDGEARKESEPKAGSFFHLALRTTDAHAAFKRAVECGGVPHIEPKNATLGERGEITAALAFVKGPDGEQIEFFQENI